MSLVVVGSMAFDEVITPFGESGKMIGGAATYAGLSASFFCNSTKLVSVIGNDFPKEELDFLESKNISYEGVQKIENKSSFFWKGSYHVDMNQRDTLDTQLNALLDFDPQLPTSYQSSEYLLLGNLDPLIQLNVLEQFKVRPKLVALDTMNFWMDSALDNLKKVLSKIDLLIINDGEAKQLSGESNLVLGAYKIMSWGIPYLIIKKGENGALLFHKEEIFSAPALPLKIVFDPTGAGDTFAGGLMGYLAKIQKTDFESLKSGIIVGSAMASFCVEKFGLKKLKEISHENIVNRVQEFVKLSKFDIKL